MPFNYNVISNDRILFKRQGEGCAQIIFFVVGSVFTLIGVLLLLFLEDPKLPASVIQWVVPLFGIIAIVVGIAIPRIQRRSIPDEIIFDNTNGRIQVNQADSEVKTAYIYYDEIEDIILSVKSRSGSSTRGASRTYYSYHVYLLKKDGGKWELLRCNSESSARTEIEKLKSLIHFSATPVREPAVVMSSKKYTVREESHNTELEWRNKLGYGPWLLLGFSCLFLTIGYAIVGTGFFMEDFPLFGMFVIGFIGLIFVIVVGGNAMKMIKHARTVYAVKISSSGLEYLERDPAGRIRKSTHLSALQLHAISFSFDTENTFRKIFVYTQEQFDKQMNMKPSFSLNFIKELYEFHRELIALEIQSLTPVEALKLENYLQQQIEKRVNKPIR